MHEQVTYLHIKASHTAANCCFKAPIHFLLISVYRWERTEQLQMLRATKGENIWGLQYCHFPAKATHNEWLWWHSWQVPSYAIFLRFPKMTRLAFKPHCYALHYSKRSKMILHISSYLNPAFYSNQILLLLLSFFAKGIPVSMKFSHCIQLHQK